MTEILNGFEKHVDIYRDYNNYLDKHQLNGICFGSSLYWTSDALREIANDKNTVGFAINDKQRFFDFGNYVQNSAIKMHRTTEGRIQLLQTLNRQEDLLAKRAGYRLHYELAGDTAARFHMKCILNNVPAYNNTAIVISTALSERILHPLEHTPSSFSHSTALLNCGGSVYLFDVNEGIYRLRKNNACSCEAVFNVIAHNLGLSGIGNIKYDLRWDGHVFMRLKKTIS